MRLEDYELLPAIAVSVEDDEDLGRIKVSLPGEEGADNCQVGALPWAYPFTMTGTYQGFTKLVAGCKVWILRNTTNPDEMWWIPMADYNPNTKNIIPGDTTDVLISRDLGSGKNVYIYHNDASGIVISLGSTKINITTSGDIILSNGEASVKLNGNSVYLNTTSTSNAAVKEKELNDTLCKINKCLQKILQGAQKGSPYTTAIANEMQSQYMDVNSNIGARKWKSDKIFVD